MNMAMSIRTPDQSSLADVEVEAIPDVVVIDTCVLLSNVLRGLLLGLARQAYFKPAWSAIIGDEWQRNAARIWGVGSSEIQDQWGVLQGAFPEADQGDIARYKTGLHRSDPKDWHVIAAARAARARNSLSSVAVLTRNIKDFNRSELRSLGLELFDPDRFLVRCWGHCPDQMQHLIEQIPAAGMAAGKIVEPLGVILKRERLFRLNRICAMKMTLD